VRGQGDGKRRPGRATGETAGKGQQVCQAS